MTPTTRAERRAAEDGRHARRDHRVPRWAAPALVAALVVGGGIGAATSAEFTDSSIADTTVTTGTLDINLDGDEGAAGSPYTIPFPVTAFEPGTSTSRTISLNNAGTIATKIALSSAVKATASGLAAQLDLTIKDGATTVYSGKLADATFATPLTVVGGAAKSLAFTVSAPTNLANTYQGKTDTVTFTFNATQASL